MCRERSTQVFLDVLMDKFYDSKYMGDVLGIGHIDAPDNESEFLKVYEKEMENYNKPLESKSKIPTYEVVLSLGNGKLHRFSRRRRC